MLSTKEHAKKVKQAQSFVDAVTNYKTVLLKHGLSFSITESDLHIELKTKVFTQLMAVSESTKFKYSQCFTDHAKLALIQSEVSLTDNPVAIEVTEALGTVVSEFKKLRDHKVYENTIEQLFAEYSLDVIAYLDAQLIVLDKATIDACQDIVNNMNKILTLLASNNISMSAMGDQAFWKFIQEISAKEYNESKVVSYSVNESMAKYWSKKLDFKKYKK